MRYFLATLMLFLACAASALAEEPLSMRELDGETLVFSVSWGGIHSADMTLSVRQTASDRMRISSKAKSLSAVRLIYPLDTTIDSDILLPSIRPLEYNKYGKEGWGNEITAQVIFDYKEKAVRYIKNGKLKKTLAFSEELQDPLSCIYFYRVFGCESDKPLRMKVSDGNKISDTTIEVIGRETVTVPAGTFKTLVVSPTLDSVGGVFAKSPGSRLFMWMTDDRFHRPVKIQSKIKVGEFVAELESFEAPGLTPAAPLLVIENPPAVKQ